MVIILVLPSMVVMDTVGEDTDQTEEEEVPREALMDQMVKGPLMEDVEGALTYLPFYWSIIYLVKVMEVNHMDISMVAEVMVFW